jgi:hypothetical protein
MQFILKKDPWKYERDEPRPINRFPDVPCQLKEFESDEQLSKEILKDIMAHCENEAKKRDEYLKKYPHLKTKKNP